MSLREFVRESNRIEGIYREPTDAEMAAHEKILRTHPSCFECSTLEEFVAVVAPGKRLREKRGMNVCVGEHVAPPGGPKITADLCQLLTEAVEDGDPWDVHRRYEALHPFMDGNGRSGRALWLWMMKQRGDENRALQLGFLHNWYYQTLAAVAA